MLLVFIGILFELMGNSASWLTVDIFWIVIGVVFKDRY